MNVPSLPCTWIDASFLCLLFQNLITEERSDIRDASLTAWRTAVSILSSSPDQLSSVATSELLLQWYATVMTPLGVAIDSSSFYRPVATSDTDASQERHNVDKSMLNQDLALITVDVIIKARVAAAVALAQLIALWSPDVRLLTSPLLNCSNV